MVPVQEPPDPSSSSSSSSSSLTPPALVVPSRHGGDGNNNINNTIDTNEQRQDAGGVADQPEKNAIRQRRNTQQQEQARRQDPVVTDMAVEGNEEHKQQRQQQQQQEQPQQPSPCAEPRWSSGVAFYPPSARYWRIGGEWYDFTGFRHPGGRQVLELARDRYEDATFAFESHHHDYARARRMIRKYRVAAAGGKKDDCDDGAVHALRRPSRRQHQRQQRRDEGGDEDGDASATNEVKIPGVGIHHDAVLDADLSPRLLDDRAFYSVLRRRVTRYLRSDDVNCAQGEPTWFCISLFWCTFAAWAACILQMYSTGLIRWAVAGGFASTVLGAFGHNWVHQPKYKRWGWALLSLDAVGFSSEGWYREHVLQHHMYTNTPWDNHFRGTDPFLVTDPTVPRNAWQRRVTPYLTPVWFSFGVYGNYAFHLVELFRGREVWSIGKLFFLVEHLVFWHKWGFLHGVLKLCFVMHAIMGNYYFPLALMNHNAHHSTDVRRRNRSQDWGIAQLVSCADWGTDLTFVQAGIYMWLNFHTVHHLFPRVDFSHHPAIQRILIQTCEEYNIQYRVEPSFWKIYREMIDSFHTPQSLMQEIIVYAGGV